VTYQLVATGGGQCFDLRAERPLVLGRALSSDLPVVDPTISRRHAELVSEAGGITVRDLGSSNGTFLNGRRVSEAMAAPGDTITFGKVSFELRERRPTPAELQAVAEPTAGTVARGGATILRERPVPISNEMLARVLRRSGAQPAPDEAAPIGTLDSKDQRKLELLLEVSKGLSRARDPDVLLGEIVGMVFEILEVDRVALLLLDERGELATRLARDAGGARLEGMVPQSIARRAVEEKVAILSDNAPEDARFGGQSIILQRVRSAICAPLIGSEGRVLGVLYVDNSSITHRYTDDDLGFLIAFAGIAGVAIENSQFAERIRHEALVRSNFERYFAPALAERIASAPGAVQLGGERRPVAVLFSDIRGFTPLSERMRADEVATLLTEYFTEMVECVFRHGGTLDKFIGDSVMAQWGAPIGGDDDAERALGAAMEMQEALRTLNAEWRATGRPELGIGIGLTYGEVFAGNIGSDRRLEYTIIGDTVNVAARLCAAAAPGEILLTDDLRRMLREPPPLVAGAPMELRGRSQPVPVYRVAT
jgi:adenylate cyclase